MQNLFTLLSSSLLTCDICSIKRKSKAFLLFTSYEFCVEDVYSDVNAKIGPVEPTPYSGSLF